MSIQLTKGANTVLPGNADPITVVLEWMLQPGKSLNLDACGFLLDERERVRSSLDFVSRHNPLFPSGALSLETPPALGRRHFQVRFSALPPKVAKLVFALGVPPSLGAWNFSQLRSACIRVLKDTEERVRYDVDVHECFESALIFGELYRQGERWKFRAIGQGFVGGLKPLAKRYGAELSAVAVPPPPLPPPVQSPRPPLPESGAPAMNAARRTASPAKPKRSRGVKLLLTGAAGAAVLWLTQCQKEDYPRYQYSSLKDCVEEWGDDDYCEYDGGHYYAPSRSYSGSSYARRKRVTKGRRVTSVSRGGFGRIGSFFSGGGRS